MEQSRNLALVLHEAEQEMTEAVAAIMQRHGLPCYLMEPMVDKLHRRISDGKTAEIAAAKRELEDQECK